MSVPDPLDEVIGKFHEAAAERQEEAKQKVAETKQQEEAQRQRRKAILDAFEKDLVPILQDFQARLNRQPLDVKRDIRMVTVEKSPTHVQHDTMNLDHLATITFRHPKALRVGCMITFGLGKGARLYAATGEAVHGRHTYKSIRELHMPDLEPAAFKTAVATIMNKMIGA